MSLSLVKEYFESQGLGDRVYIFDISTATVPLAAAAVGCQEAEIAKTLSFVTSKGPMLIVMAGDVKVDNRKYKDTFNNEKAKMLSFEETESIVGHAVGGVCPFCINDGVKVYLDISLKRFEYVHPACGSSNSAIKLTPAEVERYSKNFVSWVDVTKPMIE